MPSRPVGARTRYPFFHELAADGIKDEFYATAPGDFADPRFKILRAVVDEVIDPQGPHLGVLCRGRRSDHAAAEMLGNLRGGDADTASDRMDQNRLVGFQRTHHDEKLPSREIVDRDCSGFERGHACRALEYLFGRNADHIGVAAEPR